ncbi:MAG TPA: hypothetical protein PK867_20500, partial [Pirellulales bacterium]|nr:hypothetical protein [Pirellulales bacterium]
MVVFQRSPLGVALASRLDARLSPQTAIRPRRVGHPSSETAADDYPGDLPVVLGKTLQSWLQENPVRVQFAIPIARNGRTYELFVWYEKMTRTETPRGVLDFADHQLADADMTDFERQIKLLGGALDALVRTWVSPAGITYHRLTQCRMLTRPGQA